MQFIYTYYLYNDYSDKVLVFRHSYVDSKTIIFRTLFSMGYWLFFVSSKHVILNLKQDNSPHFSTWVQTCFVRCIHNCHTPCGLFGVFLFCFLLLLCFEEVFIAWILSSRGMFNRVLSGLGCILLGWFLKVINTILKE